MSKIIKVNLKNNSYNIYIGTDILKNIGDFHKKYFMNRSKIVIYDEILYNQAREMSIFKEGFIDAKGTIKDIRNEIIYKWAR